MSWRPRDFNMKQILPLDYQVELVESAVRRNTIIPLSKYQSKMFVSIQLIKEYSHRLTKTSEKAVILVNTVSLFDSRATQIEFHSSLKVLRICNTSCSKLVESINESQVLVVSAQTFLDLLNRKIFDLKMVSLLILDDCHYSLIVSHPYCQIMQKYRTMSTKRPRVLGLAPSFLNKRISPLNIECTAKRLERVMHSHVETASDLATICKYVHKPKKMVICARNDETVESFVVESLENLRVFCDHNSIDFCEDITPIDPRRPILEAINRTSTTLRQVGSWCAMKGCLLWQKKLAKLADELLINPKQRSILKTAETTFKLCAKSLGHKVVDVNSYAKLVGESKQTTCISDRMHKMMEILKDYTPTKRSAQENAKEPLSALIFVNERFTAFMISLLLKALTKWETELFGHLKVDFLVGNGFQSCESEEEERKIANKKLEQTLQRFRNGQLNVLVTTNVLEEGVDIRNCNLVIRFDAPADFRSFVMSSGRARRENGAFYIITEERNHRTLLEELANYSKIEKFIMDHYSPGNEILNENEIPKNADDLVSPYVVELASGKTQQVTLSGAIPLINRYCSKLPSDVFTRLVPHYEVGSSQHNDGKCSYFAKLLLPINSPLKEVIVSDKADEMSPVFASKSLALMSVALEACKKLHQQKELSDQLTPTGKELITNLLGELEDDEEYLPYLLNKCGPSKRRRLYDRKTSKSLLGTLPSLGKICIVYLIEMRLIKPISDENNLKKRRIIDPHQIEWAFGFLSNRELPSIPAFPVFQRQGQMLVKIRKANLPLFLTEELFQLISLFHQHIFEDILRIARGGLAFAPEYSPVSLLIVPLRRVGPNDADYELDMGHLRDDIRNPPVMPPEQCRRNFSFDELRYTDAIVMPWYRSEEQCAFYYVAEICRDQNPSSPFPDTKFSSFNEYFMAKYQLRIFDQNQCLLDVDHTSARMNLLLPRSGSGKMSKRPLDPSQRQILVPELVNIHAFSASLWTMIIALPTVLYRTNSLLLADEFRVKIMKDALEMADSAKTPTSADWEWDSLCYNVPQTNVCFGEMEKPTEQLHHKQQIIIKNLDQLKKINQMEEELKEKRDAKGTDATRGGHAKEEHQFEIGVWNPEVAAHLVTPAEHSRVGTSLPAENGHPPNGLKNGLITRELNSSREEEISEMIAIGTGYSIHNYGDLSDDDEDTAEFENCKFLMHNKVTGIDFGDFEHTDVRARGWDVNEEDDFAMSNIQIKNYCLPLTISCNNPDINIVTLMDDLQKNFSADLGGVFSNGDENKSAAMSRNNHSKQGAAARPRNIRKVHELSLDTMQTMDGFDKQSDEDVVGEEFFYWDDHAEEQNHTEECRIADENTKRPDSPDFTDFFLNDQRFEVTAPDISDWMQFSFMHSNLDVHPYGVSPVLLLQALTTSSASDGINLERLETIGDSFLKMAVTDYLYHTHAEQHEGKLSFARSKEVSNSRLFCLGRQRNIPFLMETAKFDPHVNWLPPCYASTSEFYAVNPLDQTDLEENVREIVSQNASDEKKLINTEAFDSHQLLTNYKKIAVLKCLYLVEQMESTGWGALEDERQHYKCENGIETITFPQQPKQKIELDLPPLPYNMLTQQWISDKSIADAVEALIGAHLIQIGQDAALRFMNWLGIRVLMQRPCIHSQPYHLFDDHSQQSLFLLYNKFDFATVEDTIGYKFANKGYLIQAFTHASYLNNRVTGCYQRLEFLGDAILDYMITRFLFEHRKQYSPGVLTDLRSALVNNTIFASLAVKYNFHKHFIMLCPPLFQMIEKFVNFCKQKDFLHCANFDDEIFMITEDEIDEGQEEDVEVPKAMGDIFESVAGAVYLDCGMDLDIVWRVFYGLMREVIEKCCTNPPQSPVRELFERKNCKAKFAKLERKLETGKVRVTVTVNDNLHFTGMGRGYRIAKCTAAKRALQHLRKLDAEKSKKEAEMK